MYLTLTLQQPLFGFVRLGRTWHQVRCVKAFHEPDGVVKNEVITPDGRIFIVDNRKLKHRMPRPNDIIHPEAPIDGLL